jgi:3-methyladenine DNA glycosylase AlkD
MAQPKAAKNQTGLILSEIRAYCAENANPARAAKYARYFNEGYDAWGLMGSDHPLWTEKDSEWRERFSKLGLAGFLKLGEQLLASGKYEEGALAIRFVKSYSAEMDREVLGALAQWFASGIRNWAHTDVLCGEIIAPLLAAGKLELDDLAPWRTSALKFQRRAVPVSMLKLVDRDPAPLLEFIRPMMMDSERVVHQGLGWFLRETWKKHPKAVEAFLLEWKDQAPRLIFQYATEKMTAAGKARFKRSKRQA